MTGSVIRATVSGSFRLAMGAVQEAVYRLTDAGALVLSPADPRVVDQFGDFVFVASDRGRAIKVVQSRHLAAIEASDLLWLVAPDGYVGQSGAMEVGFAVSVETPIFCSAVPVDLTLRQYVTPLKAPEDAVHVVTHTERRQQRHSIASVLIEPTVVLEQAHEDLERIGSELRRSELRERADAATAAARRLHSRVVRPLDRGRSRTP